MRFAHLALFFLLFMAPSQGAIIVIPDDFPTIQEGIDAAQNWDEIRVKPGTYVENVDFKGKVITLHSSDGPEFTVIDGNQRGPAVKFSQGPRPDAVLRGFTLTNGSGQYKTGSYYGGGIYMKGSMAPLIEDNIIRLNQADEGGGIYCDENTRPMILKNRIEQNSAANGGGMVCASWKEMVVANTVFSGNEASGKGGGAYCKGYETLLITNCTFHGNDGNQGGGFCFESSAGKYTTIANTILWNNTGGEIYSNFAYDPTVIHCDISGGHPGTGNFSSDPLFVDAAAGDFHILFTSPCRNTGTAAIDYVPNIDFEGDKRPYFGAIDVGADEFHPHLYTKRIETSGETLVIHILGVPQTSPVGLFFSLELLDPPLPTSLGVWYLNLPLHGPVIFSPIPAPKGLIQFPVDLPSNLPDPFIFHMQAVVGSKLTNPFTVYVE